MVFAGEPVVYRLSLDEITRLALHNNFDIQIARHEAQIAATDNDVARSLYDTMFTAEGDYRHDKLKKTSTILGSQTKSHNYNVGLSQQLPTGTNVSIDMANNRHWSDSAFTTSPLTHESQVGVTLEQDLGKNFFGIQDRGAIKITQLEVANKEYTSLDKIELTLAQAQSAYWDLALAKERVAIEEDMVEHARRLADLHREQLKDGVVEAPEAIASEVNLQKRANELILAQNDQKSKENVLKLLLNQTSDDVTIEPALELALNEIIEVPEISIRQAFKNRRDYQSAKNTLRARDINLTMKKNNLWPEINVFATLAQNGLGDHFDDSAAEAVDEENTDVFAGISVSIPILNTKARAQLKAAQLEKAKEIIGMKLLEKTIAIEVLDQVRNCNIFHEVAKNSVAIAEMETKKLAEEEKRFNAGRSDTDTIIRFQEDLVQAKLLAAQAKHRHKIAVIGLRVKEAALLKEYWEE
jgi:outer membrane protein TolC